MLSPHPLQRLSRARAAAGFWPCALAAALAASASPGTLAAEQAICWGVQVGYFRTLENARQRLNELTGAGLACSLDAQPGGQRVLCECEPTEARARLRLDSIARRWPGAFLVARVPPRGDSPAPPLAEPPPVPASAAPIAVAPPARGTDIALVPLDAGPKTPAERARLLVLRPDERRPSSQFTTTLFGRELSVGGEASLELEGRRDFALATGPDDRDRASQSLELEAYYRYSDFGALFAEAVGSWSTQEVPETGVRTSEGLARRGQTWIYSGGWFEDRVGYQLGRQVFVEPREWWWDENLDAARAYFDTPGLHLELALAQELARVSTDDRGIDPEAEDLMRLLGRAVWGSARSHRGELFLLVQDDRSATEAVNQVIAEEREDDVDADLVWVGARAIGRWKLGEAGRLHYWLDAAAVEGESAEIDYDPAGPGLSRVDSIERLDVRGWAADGGLTWETRLPGRLSFTLGYAMGSGDPDRTDSVDRAFRQTDLHDNNGRFRGVNDFRYYGELLQPELSNLRILTLAAGFRFLEHSSLELVYHRYEQVEPATRIRGDRLRINPLGLDPDIGEAVDLVLGLEEWKSWELELIGSAFEAGRAFGPEAGKRARRWVLEFTFNF